MEDHRQATCFGLINFWEIADLATNLNSILRDGPLEKLWVPRYLIFHDFSQWQWRILFDIALSSLIHMLPMYVFQLIVPFTIFRHPKNTKITFLVVLSLVISLLTVSHYRASLSGRTQGSAHISVRNKWPKEPKCFRSSTMVQMVALSKLEIKLSNLRCHDTLWELCLTDFLLQ